MFALTVVGDYSPPAAPPARAPRAGRKAKKNEPPVAPVEVRYEEPKRPEGWAPPVREYDEEWAAALLRAVARGDEGWVPKFDKEGRCVGMRPVTRPCEDLVALQAAVDLSIR